MKFGEGGVTFDLLGYAVAGCHDVETINQGAPASARSDSYVRLRKEWKSVFSPFVLKKRNERSIDEKSDLPWKTAEPRVVASHDPSLRGLLRGRYSAACN